MNAPCAHFNVSRQIIHIFIIILLYKEIHKSIFVKLHEVKKVLIFCSQGAVVKTPLHKQRAMVRNALAFSLNALCGRANYAF